MADCVRTRWTPGTHRARAVAGWPSHVLTSHTEEEQVGRQARNPTYRLAASHGLGQGFRPGVRPPSGSCGDPRLIAASGQPVPGALQGTGAAWPSPGWCHRVNAQPTTARRLSTSQHEGTGSPV